MARSTSSTRQQQQQGSSSRPSSRQNNRPPGDPASTTAAPEATEEPVVANVAMTRRRSKRHPPPSAPPTKGGAPPNPEDDNNDDDDDDVPLDKLVARHKIKKPRRGSNNNSSSDDSNDDPKHPDSESQQQQQQRQSRRSAIRRGSLRTDNNNNNDSEGDDAPHERSKQQQQQQRRRPSLGKDGRTTMAVDAAASFEDDTTKNTTHVLLDHPPPQEPDTTTTHRRRGTKRSRASPLPPMRPSTRRRTAAADPPQQQQQQHVAAADPPDSETTTTTTTSWAAAAAAATQAVATTSSGGTNDILGPTTTTSSSSRAAATTQDSTSTQGPPNDTANSSSNNNTPVHGEARVPAATLDPVVSSSSSAAVVVGMVGTKQDDAGSQNNVTMPVEPIVGKEIPSTSTSSTAVKKQPSPVPKDEPKQQRDDAVVGGLTLSVDGGPTTCEDPRNNNAAIETKEGDNRNNNEPSENAARDDSRKHQDMASKMDSAGGGDSRHEGVVATADPSIGSVVGDGKSGDDDKSVFPVARQAAHREDGQWRVPEEKMTSRVMSKNELPATEAILSKAIRTEKGPFDSRQSDLSLSKDERSDSADLRKDASMNHSVKGDSRAVSTGLPVTATSLEAAASMSGASGVPGKAEHPSSSLAEQEGAQMNDLLVKNDGPVEPVLIKQEEHQSEKAAANNMSLPSTNPAVKPREVVKELVAPDSAGKNSKDVDPMDVNRIVDAVLVLPDGARKDNTAGSSVVVDDKNGSATLDATIPNALTASPMDEKPSEYASATETKEDRHLSKLAAESTLSEILAVDSEARTKGSTDPNVDRASLESKVAPQDHLDDLSKSFAPVLRTAEQSLTGWAGEQAESNIMDVHVDSLRSDSARSMKAPQRVGGMVSPGQSKARVSVQEELAQGRTSFELSQMLEQSLSPGQPEQVMEKELGDSTEICFLVAIGAASAHTRETTENLATNQGKVADTEEPETAVKNTVAVVGEAASVQVVTAETKEKLDITSTAVTQEAVVEPSAHNTPGTLQIEEAQPAVVDAAKGDTSKKSVSDSPAELIKVQSNSVVAAMGGQMNDNDHLGSASDIQSQGKPGSKVPAQTLDQKALRETEYLAEVENLRIPLLLSGNVKAVQETRVSLELIKVMIYSAGCRVHTACGYERMFAAYWKALAMRIGGRLSEAESRKYQRVVNAYLKTKAMRKLHNKLILALLGRCIQPTAPLREISAFIPERLQNRIRIVPKPSAKSHLGIDERSEPFTISPGTVEQSEGPLYKPVVLEKVSSSAYSHEPPLAPASSMRIPGALVVDPRIRQIAEGAGMKTSENAIWLLVVALREFTVTVLGDTLSTMKAVETGLVPGRPSIRPRLLPKKASKNEVASSIKKLAENPKPATKCITPVDIHITTTGIPSGSKSLGGCISRTTFERSLFSSFDNSIVVGGNAFQDVKKFFVSAISSREPALKKTKTDPSSQQQPSSASESRVNDERLRKSPVSKGLGQGAKDLASLKARSNIPKASPGTESISVDTAGSAGNTGEFVGESTSTTGSVQQQQAPQQHHSDDDQQQAEQKDRDKGTASILRSGENQNVATLRKGKGFGVKNLAAMRARSEGAAEAAKAESVTDEKTESSAKPVAPVQAVAVSIPAPIVCTNTFVPSPALPKKDASPPTGGSLQSGALREAPTFPKTVPAASIQSQHYHQRTGIKHNIAVPYANQNSQVATQSMQNPAVALASAQLAQGLANALIQNAGNASCQHPSMVSYPAQPPKGISLGQLAQMVPGMQQGRHFTQIPHASAAQLQHHQQHMASSQSAQNTQAMAYAKVFAQNMANVTVSNHGATNANGASVHTLPATMAPAAAVPYHSSVTQSPAGPGIEPARSLSSPEIGAPAQPAPSTSTAESPHKLVESREKRE